MLDTLLIQAAVCLSVTGWSAGAFVCIRSALADRQPAVTTKIVLEKAEWPEGDTICARLILSNPNNHAVGLSLPRLLTPVLTDSAGVTIAKSPRRLFPRCGGVIGPEPQFSVPPTGESSLSIRIDTDPACWGAFHRLPPGKYIISLPDWAAGAAADPAPVSFTITPAIGYQIGRRICSIGIADDRVAVLREDGDVQSFSLTDGWQLAHTTLRDVSSPDDVRNDAAFSPDATSVVRVIPTGNPRDYMLQICAVADGATPRTYSIPDPIDSARMPWTNGFDRINGNLRVSTSMGIYEMRLADGTFTRVRNWLPYVDVDISPDGNYAIGPGHTIRRRDGTDLEAEWPGYSGRRLMGVTGVYGPTRDAGRGWRSYDGTTSTAFAGLLGTPLAESPDGKLVAWASETHTSLDLDGGEINVYSTQDQRLLWTLKDGKHHVVGFARNSTRLVAFTTTLNNSKAASTLDRVDVLDAETGACVRTFELKPPVK